MRKCSQMCRLSAAKGPVTWTRRPQIPLHRQERQSTTVLVRVIGLATATARIALRLCAFMERRDRVVCIIAQEVCLVGPLRASLDC